MQYRGGGLEGKDRSPPEIEIRRRGCLDATTITTNIIVTIIAIVIIIDLHSSSSWAWAIWPSSLPMASLSLPFINIVVNHHYHQHSKITTGQFRIFYAKCNHRQHHPRYLDSCSSENVGRSWIDLPGGDVRTSPLLSSLDPVRI